MIAVRKAIVDLPIRLKGNSKRTSGNSSSPLEAHSAEFRPQESDDMTS